MDYDIHESSRASERPASALAMHCGWTEGFPPWRGVALQPVFGCTRNTRAGGSGRLPRNQCRSRDLHLRTRSHRVPLLPHSYRITSLYSVLENELPMSVGSSMSVPPLGFNPFLLSLRTSKGGHNCSILGKRLLLHKMLQLYCSHRKSIFSASASWRREGEREVHN